MDDTLTPDKDSSAILEAFGRALRYTRQRAGLTQEAVALRSGLDRSYVGQVERGERNISLINIAKLAEALEVPASQLLAEVARIEGEPR